MNGDTRAPLAEQEQEEEEEQDDEVLSSIEEQLEFGDDDMNDLNGECCAYFLSHVPSLLRQPFRFSLSVNQGAKYTPAHGIIPCSRYHLP